MVDCFDAIWDNYPEDSVASLTRQCCGTGPRTNIRDSFKSKTRLELFSFPSEQIVKRHLGGKLLNSKCESVISNRPCDVSPIQPCNNSQYQARISFILRIVQDVATTQHMFALLIVLSWSLSYAFSQYFFDSKSFGWVSEVGVASVIPAPILDLSDI